MPIIGNPWVREAGQFGEGLGSTLGQAMINMPQQRAMLAQQQAMMRQSQQQAMLDYALRQQANQQQYQLGSSEMAVRQIELAKQLQALEHANKMAEQKLKQGELGKWTIKELQDGRVVKQNSVTGETELVPLNAGGTGGGLGGLNVSGTITPNQFFDTVNNANRNYANVLATPELLQNTNFVNSVSNLQAQLNPMAQKYLGGLGSGGAPPAMSTNAPPALGATNMPAMPPQTTGRFRFNPATGQLEPKL